MAPALNFLDLPLYLRDLWEYVVGSWFPNARTSRCIILHANENRNRQQGHGDHKAKCRQRAIQSTARAVCTTWQISFLSAKANRARFVRAAPDVAPLLGVVEAAYSCIILTAALETVSSKPTRK
mgnify:CR=1 FL=1